MSSEPPCALGYTHPASHGPNPQVEGPGLGLLQSGIVRALNSDISFSWWGRISWRTKLNGTVVSGCAIVYDGGGTGAADGSAALGIYIGTLWRTPSNTSGQYMEQVRWISGQACYTLLCSVREMAGILVAEY